MVDVCIGEECFDLIIKYLDESTVRIQKEIQIDSITVYFDCIIGQGHFIYLHNNKTENQVDISGAVTVEGLKQYISMTPYEDRFYQECERLWLEIS